MEKDFFERVYDVVKLIPKGRVTTYGAIAKSIGSPKAARMVGWALNKCSSQKEFVPAHRVLNRNGLLTGKMSFPGQTTMKEILENESIVVEDDKVIHFKSLFWDPLTEIK